VCILYKASHIISGFLTMSGVQIGVNRLCGKSHPRGRSVEWETIPHFLKH